MAPHTLLKLPFSPHNLVEFWKNLVEFWRSYWSFAPMAVAMCPLTSRIALLRRLAALSHCPLQVASSSSVPRGHNSDIAVPCFESVSSGYGAFVREYQSEVSVSPSASSIQESSAAVAGEYAIRNEPRNDWMREDIQAIYESPLMDLLLYGAQVHKHTHKWREVQQCTLLSIKTGGCSEDCSYCPQSSRYDTGVKAQLLSEDVVLEAAKKKFLVEGKSNERLLKEGSAIYAAVCGKQLVHSFVKYVPRKEDDSYVWLEKTLMLCAGVDYDFFIIAAICP